MNHPIRAVAQTFEEAAAKMRRRINAESAVQQRREDVGCTNETCEQRRAREYGIGPDDYSSQC